MASQNEFGDSSIRKSLHDKIINESPEQKKALLSKKMSIERPSTKTQKQSKPLPLKNQESLSPNKRL